jgi:hypothetical protein
MRKMFFALLAVLLILPGSTLADDPEQFDINGNSYFTPPEGVGTVTTVVALLDPPAGFVYPITVDFVTNEYTFYFQSTITSITPGAMTTTITYADADFYIYEDPAKNGSYGTFPPNGTSPSTFQNGTVVLYGTMSNINRLNYTMGFPDPTIIAECTFLGGTKFNELIQGENWTFHGGLSTNPLLGIPMGYNHRWSTRIIFSGPIPVDESTWGHIKALYGQNN